MIPKLWQHQQIAINKAKPRYGLFFDPGCGKSRTVLEIFNRTQEKRAIIFAPLNVCRNWQNEIAIFSNIKKYYLVAGSSKTKKLQTLKNYLTCFQPAILIINIESVRSKDYLTLLKQSRTNFVVIDESHMLKSPTSLQTKNMLQLLSVLHPQYLYLLSGTPAPQGEIDLWSSLYMLGATKQPFYLWRKLNFIDQNEYKKGRQGYFPRFVVNERNRALIKSDLHRVSMRVDKRDTLDLPEYIKTNIYTELSPEYRRQYNSMFEKLFAVDENGDKLTAVNVLSRTLRLQQIVSQCPARIEALKSSIELTQNQQFIIWTIFSETYKSVSKVLEEMGITFGFLTGEQSAEERHETMESFQAGKIKALIAHPRAGGVGVNLTAASHAIYFTKNFNIVDNIQSEARNYRGGSIEKHKIVTRIDVIAQDTIDETITQSLEKKRTVQEFLLTLKEKNNE